MSLQRFADSIPHIKEDRNTMSSLPKVHSKYGAPMGRAGAVNQLQGQVRLGRVRINRDGYDDGGAYWGHGEALWHAHNDDGEAFFRAPNRDAAKAYVVANACGPVRFYR